VDCSSHQNVIHAILD